MYPSSVAADLPSGQSLWPTHNSTLTDSVIDFLREQGRLLTPHTNGILKAEVTVGLPHLPATFISGLTTSPEFSPEFSPGKKETTDYYISHTNSFLASSNYRLFTFTRSIHASYPFLIQVFPDEHLVNYSNDRNTYMSSMCVDLASFKTQYVKIVQSDKVANLIGLLTKMGEGVKRSDLDNERLQIQ